METQIWNKKFRYVFLLLFYLLLTGCKKNTSNDLIVFDVNMNVPVKTLDIEDVADIEYLVLDVTDDDYLFTTFASMSDSYVICRGARREFLFFSRTTGKPVSKISRYGNGPGEYTTPAVVVYSEEKDDFFMIDYPIGIKVYGRDGTFKRMFPHKANFYPSTPTALFDYDEDYLLLNGFSFSGDMKDTSFVLISKQDGFIEEIYIPYQEHVSLIIMQEGGGIPENNHAVRNNNDFLLTDYSSDTVYRFTPEHKLIPVLVRTPSIQKMDPKIILHSWLETRNYLFFSTTNLEVGLSKTGGFQVKGYLMEKRSGSFFRSNVQMADYKGKEIFVDPPVIVRTSNQHTGIIVLSALELQMAYEDNKLSGKLKEVTERLTKDDEYVFMILKFK